MNKKIYSLVTHVFSVAFLSFPLVASAALQVPRFDTVVENYIGGLRIGAGALFISVAVFFVVMGVFRYLGSGDDSERRAEGARLFFWGLVTLFIMVVMWGLVNLVVNTFFNKADISTFQRDNRLWNSSL